jgi:hypothetical protein
MRTLRTVGVLTAVGVLMLAGSGGSWSQQINCTATGTCNSTQGQPTGSSRSGQGGQPQPQISPNVNDSTDRDSPLDSRLEMDQAKMRNLERQKKLVDDTARLVNLANELKDDVDKSNKDTMSLDVIRKADEIEKLAHSVKEKMKGT